MTGRLYYRLRLSAVLSVLLTHYLHTAINKKRQRDKQREITPLKRRDKFRTQNKNCKAASNKPKYKSVLV
jgi:hypothetical protein